MSSVRPWRGAHLKDGIGGRVVDDGSPGQNDDALQRPAVGGPGGHPEYVVAVSPGASPLHPPRLRQK